ncbi:YwmB family TATA-box binding protein [Bacillus sp. Bva_UNVM-123]|uniref:YwmB family TATA-box binding protein n=1 Tax=Bacillus sp. Bva_UNVM-123 TaxID=2829798 RepID=UPI00391F85CB
MGKRKKVTFLIMNLVSFLILTNSVYLNVVKGKGELDLGIIASVLLDENIFIREWSLHAREMMEESAQKNDVLKKIDHLRQEFPDWKWTQKTFKNHQETMAIFKDGTKTEKIKISTPKNHDAKTYIIYEVVGQGWNEQIENKLAQEMENRFSAIFRGKPTIFSCIKGEFNDKMNKTLPNKMEKILAAFQATEIESLKENSFMSVSSYSTKFQKTIETKDGKYMNLQLGMRKAGDDANTTLVVGTPIITVEY